MQHQLYQTKFTEFWLSTVNSCRRNPRALWRAVDMLLQPPKQCPSEKLSADHFVRFFRGKVDSIRASTRSADPPVIVTRQVSPLSQFTPATVTQVVSLLKNTCKDMRTGSDADLATQATGSIHFSSHMSSVQPVIGTRSLSCTTQTSSCSSTAEETDVGSR